MDKQKYITREEAVSFLRNLADSEILDEGIIESLDEIAELIEYELDGEHFWGQLYSAGDKLRVAYRSDLLTDTLRKDIINQHVNARFIPAPIETEDLREYFKEKSEYRGEEFEEESFRNYYGLDTIK